MIFITTAGKVGSAAARLIAQRDVPVRVLVRQPEKAGRTNARAVALTADGDCEYVTDDVPQILGRPAGLIRAVRLRLCRGVLMRVRGRH